MSSTKLVALSTAFRWGNIESFIKPNAPSSGAPPAALPFRQSLAPRVRQRIKVVPALFEQAALDQVFDRVEDREARVGVVAARLEKLVQVERLPVHVVEHSENFERDVFGRAHASAFFFGGCAGLAATFF